MSLHLDERITMLNHFERTVHNCLAVYPTIFPTRARVLDHLFCILGGGYDWKGGRLVQEGENLSGRTDRAFFQTVERNVAEQDLIIEREHILLKKIAKEELSKKTNKKENNWCNKVIKEKYKHFVYDPQDVELRNLLTQMKSGEIYPICKEYAHLINFPNNIERCWLDGINECAQMIIDSKLTDPYFVEDGTAEEYKAKQVVFAKKALGMVKSLERKRKHIVLPEDYALTEKQKKELRKICIPPKEKRTNK